MVPSARVGAIVGAVVGIIAGAIDGALVGAGVARIGPKGGSASPYLGKTTIRHLLKHTHTSGVTLSQLESYIPWTPRPVNCCTVVPPNLGNQRRKT